MALKEGQGTGSRFDSFLKETPDSTFSLPLFLVGKS